MQSNLDRRPVDAFGSDSASRTSLVAERAYIFALKVMSSSRSKAHNHRDLHSSNQNCSVRRASTCKYSLHSPAYRSGSAPKEQTLRATPLAPSIVGGGATKPVNVLETSGRIRDEI